MSTKKWHVYIPQPETYTIFKDWKRGREMDKKTVKTILFTAFLAAAVIAVAVKPEFFIGIISRTLKLLTPVFFGLAFAFVMNMPVYSSACYAGRDLLDNNTTACRKRKAVHFQRRPLLQQFSAVLQCA